MFGKHLNFNMGLDSCNGSTVTKVSSLPQKGEESKLYYNTTNKQYYSYNNNDGNYSVISLDNSTPTPFDAIFNIDMLGVCSISSNEILDRVNVGDLFLAPWTSIRLDKLQATEVSVKPGDQILKDGEGTLVSDDNTYQLNQIDSYRATKNMLPFIILNNITKYSTTNPLGEQSSVGSAQNFSFFNQYDGNIYTLELEEIPEESVQLLIEELNTPSGEDPESKKSGENEEETVKAYGLFIKNIEKYNDQIYSLGGITYKFIKSYVLQNDIEMELSDIKYVLEEVKNNIIYSPIILHVKTRVQYLLPSGGIALENHEVGDSGSSNRDILTEIKGTTAIVDLNEVHYITNNVSDLCLGAINLSSLQYVSDNYSKYEPIYRMIPITGRFYCNTKNPSIYFIQGLLRLQNPLIELLQGKVYEYNIFNGVINIMETSSNQEVFNTIEPLIGNYNCIGTDSNGFILIYSDLGLEKPQILENTPSLNSINESLANDQLDEQEQADLMRQKYILESYNSDGEEKFIGVPISIGYSDQSLIELLKTQGVKPNMIINKIGLNKEGAPMINTTDSIGFTITDDDINDNRLNYCLIAPIRMLEDLEQYQYSEDADNPHYKYLPIKIEYTLSNDEDKENPKVFTIDNEWQRPTLRYGQSRFSYYNNSYQGPDIPIIDSQR